MYSDKSKPLNGPSFQCYDCPEIKRLDKRVNGINQRLDAILIGVISTLITVLGSLIV